MVFVCPASCDEPLGFAHDLSLLPPGGGDLTEVLAASLVLRQRRLQRRLAAAGIRMGSALQDDLSMLAGTAEGSMYGLLNRRQLQANTRYTMPLLEEAKNLHRSYEVSSLFACRRPVGPGGLVQL